jgi:hypothetical protein
MAGMANADPMRVWGLVKRHKTSQKGGLEDASPSMTAVRVATERLVLDLAVVF